MQKMYKIISTVLLGIVLLTGFTNEVFAQCDPRMGTTTYLNTTTVDNIGTILVGQPGTLAFSFGVGPQSTCNAAAGNVAGNLTLTITFPAEYSPDANFVVTGPQASLYNWTYNAAAKTLVGVNNAPIPPAPLSAKFEVLVTGKVPTPGTAIANTHFQLTSNGITNTSAGNDASDAGVNVDPAPVPPVATNDNASTTGSPVLITVLTNDTPGSSPIDPTKVMLITPGTGVPTTSVNIPGEGTYTVNTTTGVITFTPDPAVTTPVTSTIKYTITDTNNLTSNQATITVINTPLPVTLTVFKATKEGKIARLNWETTEETNSDHFEIQHSISGKDWNKIGTVDSHGDSKVRNVYSYTDTNPANGENLYRLKMIDRDATFAYSRIQSLKFDGQNGPAISIYPNPSTDKVFIQDADLSQVKLVSILDMNGHAVFSSNKISADGISVSKLISGTYILHITNINGSVSNHKIVVAK